MKKPLFVAITMAGALMLPDTVPAEEGGSAHYLPGSAASFVDAFPGIPGSVAVFNYFTAYDAGASPSRQLPLNGLLTAGIDATVYADSLTAIYQTPWNPLGGGFALGVSVPYVWVEVDATAQRINPGGVPGPVFTASDSANGIGDILMIPFMLGWTNLAPDLKLDTRLLIYAPTGEYTAGELANTGKNYWTFEPGLMVSWLSSKIGTEVSLYTGVDFNTENTETDYTSGTSLHVDLTLAQHLPLGEGIIGIGANGFYYEQLTGDEGASAVLGDFKGHTYGVGPVLSYVHPLNNGKAQLLAEVKWLPELDTDKRLEGDYVWFKLGVLF